MQYIEPLRMRVFFGVKRFFRVPFHLKIKDKKCVVLFLPIWTMWCFLIILILLLFSADNKKIKKKLTNSIGDNFFYPCSWSQSRTSGRRAVGKLGELTLHRFLMFYRLSRSRAGQAVGGQVRVCDAHRRADVVLRHLKGTAGRHKWCDVYNYING